MVLSRVAAASGSWTAATSTTPFTDASSACATAGLIGLRTVRRRTSQRNAQ